MSVNIRAFLGSLKKSRSDIGSTGLRRTQGGGSKARCVPSGMFMCEGYIGVSTTGCGERRARQREELAGMWSQPASQPTPWELWAWDGPPGCLLRDKAGGPLCPVPGSWWVLGAVTQHEAVPSSGGHGYRASRG